MEPVLLTVYRSSDVVPEKSSAMGLTRLRPVKWKIFALASFRPLGNSHTDVPYTINHKRTVSDSGERSVTAGPSASSSGALEA